LAAARPANSLLSPFCTGPLATYAAARAARVTPVLGLIVYAISLLRLPLRPDALLARFRLLPFTSLSTIFEHGSSSPHRQLFDPNLGKAIWVQEISDFYFLTFMLSRWFAWPAGLNMMTTEET